MRPKGMRYVTASLNSVPSNWFKGMKVFPQDIRSLDLNIGKPLWATVVRDFLYAILIVLKTILLYNQTPHLQKFHFVHMYCQI